MSKNAARANRQANCDSADWVRVKWDLSFPSAYLFGTLAGQMSMSRSQMATELLADASARWHQEDAPGGFMVRREGVRSTESLLLPVALVSSLEADAAERHWSVELLVEHLASDYLAVWSGALARDAIAPWSSVTPRRWLSDEARQPRVLSRRPGVA